PAGNLVVGSNETIRLRLYSNPTGTQLEGTLVKQAQEGVATFDDLVIRKASPGYQITAAAGGYQSAVSRVFTVASNEPVKDLSTLTVAAERPGGGKVATADGRERIRIEAQIRDSEGNPLAGFPVTLSVSGDGYTFHPNPGSGGSLDMVTSGTGRITAWVSSVVAETKTITLR